MISSLIYSIRILGLLLLMTGLIRCKCGALPNFNPESSNTPSMLDNADKPETPDNADKPNNPNNNKQGNRTAITQEMLDRLKKENPPKDTSSLQQVLEVFQLPQLNEESKKVKSIDYGKAMEQAVSIHDQEIIQALLERKDQVEGNIDWNELMRSILWRNDEVALQTLLNLKVIEAGQEVLKTAIGYYINPSILKILLDPQQNPAASTLKVQELLEVAFSNFTSYLHHDGEGKIKSVLLALLDPKINPRTNELTINIDMLKFFVNRNSHEDILSKLLETRSLNKSLNKLTSQNLTDLFGFFPTYLDQSNSKILKILLQNLIEQEGFSVVKDILQQDPSNRFYTDTTGTSLQPNYETIFKELGL